MDTKLYITALSFAAIALVVEGEGEFPVGEWIGQAAPPFITQSQIPTHTKPKKQRKPSASYQSPVYKPPKNIGAPGGRVGAGSRGNESLTLFALVPDHLGLTINSQPTLYWYLSKPVPFPLILTINDEKRVKPILEVTLQTSSKAGIHSVPLNAFNIFLELDTEYQWFVSLDLDAKSQSKDIVAGGTIKRIVPSDELQKKLRLAIPERLTAIYSEEGLWYDALATISNLCETSHRGNQHCASRRELLEQIDLSLDLMEIAKAEENIWIPKESQVQSPIP